MSSTNLTFRASDLVTLDVGTFEKRFPLCSALAGLELNMWIRLALNSEMGLSLSATIPSRHQDFYKTVAIVKEAEVENCPFLNLSVNEQRS